jgi:hypothetical protein
MGGCPVEGIIGMILLRGFGISEPLNLGEAFSTLIDSVEK